MASRHEILNHDENLACSQIEQCKHSLGSVEDLVVDDSLDIPKRHRQQKAISGQACTWVFTSMHRTTVFSGGLRLRALPSPGNGVSQLGLQPGWTEVSHAAQTPDFGRGGGT